MSSGHFKVKASVDLDAVQIGDKFEESDFSCISQQGKFVQMEYISTDDEAEPYECKPGVWTIIKTMQGLKLETTSFVNDKILEDLISTKDISDKIDCFFNRLHVYKKHGIEVPKRSILLYGPPGTGKSSAITKAIKQYNLDGKTAIVVWPTDRIEAGDVKGFIKAFKYVAVDRVIFVAEDIGGIQPNETRLHSESSLLSLLDNQEKTFSIPTLIIATTNHPEAFLGNLTNRPGRFDDKIEVGFPSKENRSILLKFFIGQDANEQTDKALEHIKDDKFAEFTPAHIKEIIIRSDIYDKTLVESMDEMSKELQFYKKAFTKSKGSMGILGGYDD